MDVKTTFLNGGLIEIIFMDQPEGYAVEGSEYLICLLAKGLYGLKQSRRAWHKKINSSLTQVQKFTQSHADSNVYIKREGESYVILALYVDDAILFSNNIKFVEAH